MIYPDSRERRPVTRLQKESYTRILEASVNLATQQAHIEYLPGLIHCQGLVRAVEEAGYQAREALAPTETTIDRADKGWAKEYRTLLYTCWFTDMVSLPIIVFSYPQEEDYTNE
jgi:hypothetical protein